MIEFFQGLSIKLSRTCIMEKNKSFKVIIGNVHVDIFTRYFIKNICSKIFLNSTDTVYRRIHFIEILLGVYLASRIIIYVYRHN